MTKQKSGETANQEQDTARAAFGPDENKDLARTVDETKEQETVKVTMAQHGQHDGEDLVPGKSYELPRAVALSMIAAKRAHKA